VTAVEAVTPLGFDAEQTCAAIRAGANRFTDHPFHISMVSDPETEEGEPLVASLLSELDPDLEGRERLLELAIPAFKNLLAKVGFKRAELPKGGLLISLPVSLPGREGGSDFISELTNRLGIKSLKVKKACHLGHTGMVSCILEASKLLSTGEIDFCIVAGIESYHDTEILETLDEAYRLKSARAVDGFIPGEGAVLLLLETAAKATARKARPLVILSCIGMGKEPRNYASDLLSSGAGLSQALLPALAKTTNQTKVSTASNATIPTDVNHQGRWILCDINGESYRAAEWGIVRTRLGEKLDPIAALTHPADCLGDTGAASAGILIMYAMHAFARGYAPNSEALIWNASEDGARSALIITAVGST
jgi:3-oxoacyl-[acyl-carrier-protein] synthase-1